MKPQITHEYAFDVKLAATVRFRAASEAQALKILANTLGFLECEAVDQFWPDGLPVRFEASIDDCDPYLFELDGREAL